jgi:Uma2 family endonuclease
MNYVESSIHTKLLILLSRQFDGVLPHVGWQSGNNVFSPDVLVYEEKAYQRRRDQYWFTGKPLFLVEVITQRRNWQQRQERVNAYVAHGAGAVVEVFIPDETALVHHPENVNPLFCRSWIEWPFVLDLEHLFEEVRSRLESSRC